MGSLGAARGRAAALALRRADRRRAAARTCAMTYMRRRVPRPRVPEWRRPAGHHARGRRDCADTRLRVGAMGEALESGSQQALAQEFPAIDRFVIEIKRARTHNAIDIAKKTASLLRSVISQARLPAADERTVTDALVHVVKSSATRLVHAKDIMVVAGNMVRRVLHAIREESAQLEAEYKAEEEEEDEEEDEEEEEELNRQKAAKAIFSANPKNPVGRSPEGGVLRMRSLHNLLEFSVGNQGVASDREDSPQGTKKSDTFQYRLKHNVIECINELIDDLDTIKATIAEQAIEHIHANEVVLTLGYSELVLTFLKEAGKKRQFQVFVAEGAPKYQGHKLAKELAQANINTTLISDAAVIRAA
eukprot:scaffold779_cov355-Prasinococcus_capsulatus_cf.AAC.2